MLQVPTSAMSSSSKNVTSFNFSYDRVVPEKMLQAPTSAMSSSRKKSYKLQLQLCSAMSSSRKNVKQLVYF